MTTELAPGQILLGRYRLDRRLDEGGMAVVWAGTHLLTGKQVALKLLKADAARDEAVRRRMLREARAACAVVHPNVVQIHDVLELPDGSPVLVMDLLQGESLREKLLRHKTLSIEETATLLLPVVSGAGTAHAAGVIHRDLKPENIFLAQEAGATCVKVLDFGIAKLVASANNISQANALTNTGTMLGTPYYMAPEQILGEAMDHRADIWSLGVILYECLVGQRPTEAENIGKILKRVLTNEIEPLSRRAPELPKDVTALVDRMLSQSVKDRPASLHEVSEVLARHAKGVTLSPFGAPSTAPDVPSDSAPKVDEAARAARAKEVGDAARVAAKDGLAETLIAPGTATPRARAATGAMAVMTTPAPASERDSSRPASGDRGGKAGGRGWRTAAIGLGGLLIAGAAAAYFLLFAKGRERPYVPATAQVAPLSGGCPAGMALVPGGPFRMGSDEGKDDERPVHALALEPFCMDVTEVTTGEYHECARKGGCRAPESTVRWSDISEDVKERDSLGCTGTQTEKEHVPINCVSWEDADVYCRAVGKRLPTEAEWEFAAGGGDERRRYPWGSAPPSVRLVNACDQSCAALSAKRGGKQRPMLEEDDGAAQVAPVGSFPEGAGRFGMLDMAGNVWEWTASPYCTYPEHACSSQYRVFRGGGWGGTLTANLRPTARMWSHPLHRYNDVGFRCVKGL